MVGVLALLLMVIRFSGFDYTLADFLFNLEGGAWSLRHHPVFERGFHQGGRELIVILAALLLTAWTCTFPVRRLRRFRRPIGYLLASMAVSTLLVSGWKTVSVDLCPWSMVRYGGEQFVQPGSVSAGIAGHCFPAGHASAGFCLFGLFFLAERYRPRWRWRALAVPLMLGGVFGLTQQIRGAHFVSHDLWAALSCWSVAWVLARLLLGESDGLSNVPECPAVGRLELRP